MGPVMCCVVLCCLDFVLWDGERRDARARRLLIYL